MERNKSSREEPMSLAVEMRNAVILLAGERAWGETRQRWLERAARRAGISYRQARRLFYSECGAKADVVERVRAAVRNRQSERLREARDAYEAIVSGIKRAEAALRIRDEDFHSPEIDALREILSGVHRPMAQDGE